MTRSNGNPREPVAITTLSVSGFKSISEKQTIDIRPLTLLAGANSSGKSSMMQPLLLLKQTLETTYDPGPLLLNGPNASFTSASQFWPASSSGSRPTQFLITIGASNKASFGVALHWNSRKKMLGVTHNSYTIDDETTIISPGSSLEHLRKEEHKRRKLGGQRPNFIKIFEQLEARIIRSRFFLEFVYSLGEREPSADSSIPSFFSFRSARFARVIDRIMEVIHLPGLRGNPERTYPVTAIGPRFPGTFERYVASAIADWDSQSAAEIKALGDDLTLLGLTWKIGAKRVDDTQVELQVGRMLQPRQGGARDLVNIADVGFGVSQTLPVVVALRAARPRQLVYIEQPEIHLHPRAQVAMARLLVNAAKRGVRVVAETHSSLILLGVQTLVAQGVINPDLVGLNWFTRSEKEGTTRIESADLDEAGRFGDWPEDFDDTALKAESSYLSAAEDRLAGN